MGWVDGEGSEHGKDLVREHSGELASLGVAEFGPAHHLDAFVHQARKHLAVETLGVTLGQLLGVVKGGFVNFARQQAAGGTGGDSRGDAALKTGDAHHEELIEVAGEDGEELGTLQERVVSVFGEFEHPSVERQPRQFTIDETVVG